MKTHGIFLLSLLFLATIVSGQNSKNVYIDEKGVMRWEKTNEEVEGFGVNYTVPFAHAYRNAKKMGIDPKKAIDNDVYHFTRLGFDLYRVHVWDTQISDTEGNLLENEYLDAFDYLLYKLKQHNINYVITPIAFWGDGWPEPDSETPGFSHKYGKADCLTSPDAIKAQQNYLFQFLNHVNPYTKVAFKSDDNVIAFEISNEPHHRGNPEDVTTFVKGMVDAMKKTGTKKPIFYNMSHAVQFMDAYFKGGADGGTFQWYPTGLGYQKELSGNLLPNVDNYDMPFDAIIKKHQGAKLVYEFDAADVGKSYIYPAMARSFRTAGIQIATHFSYDPTYLAPFNTEYNTHYMNLNFSPSKALALKICSEIFHEMPLHKDFGKYPHNTSFGNVKIDYNSDLAEYNSNEKFFYTNSTSSAPKDEKSLKEIAGFGNSSIVKYEGKGAYFLDKISDGVWRLEVQPDAIWVDNLFGKNSFEKTVAVIKWETHSMAVNLSDLSTDFLVETINENNSFKTKTESTSFDIRPGTYILSKSGASKKWTANDAFKTNKLNDFFAPESTVKKPWLMHNSPVETTVGALTLEVDYVAPQKPDSIKLMASSGRERMVIDFEQTSPYHFTATIPSEKLSQGYLEYHIVVFSGDSPRTYPADKIGNPFDWDFYEREPYKTRIVPSESPIKLFDAKNDSEDLVLQWRRGFKLLPNAEGEDEFHMNIEELFVIDEENSDALSIYDYTFKHFVLEKIQERKNDLDTKDSIVFYGKSLNDKPCKLQIAFVMDDGSAFGNVIEIGTEPKEYKLSLKDLKSVKTVTMPRPYPSFLPYYFEHNNKSSFDINRVESLQFSIGPDIPEAELKDSHGIAIIKVNLE